MGNNEIETLFETYLEIMAGTYIISTQDDAFDTANLKNNIAKFLETDVYTNTGAVIRRLTYPTFGTIFIE